MKYRRAAETKSRISQSLYVPGPGAYNIDRSIDNGVKYGIGTAKRPNLNIIDENIPGPDTYDIQNTHEGEFV